MAGQTELTGRQRRSLADDGYLLVPSLLAADAVSSMAGRLGRLVRATVDEWDATPDMKWEEGGVVRLRLDLADSGFAWHSGTLNYEYDRDTCETGHGLILAAA